jgi:hypothetical protein
VSGLTGAGLSLRLSRTDISFAGGATAFEDLPIAAGAATFGFPIPASNTFNIGVLAQPTGQTCTITRASAFSLGPNITSLSVACVNNATDPLSGTYSALNEDGDGRNYVNFNSDGTYTTALIHNDADCNIAGDVRNGNGVEYGVFSWDDSTGVLELVGAAAVDTNGDCGFHDNGDLHVTRVGNAVEIREFAGGPPVATASAVDSVAGTLVGAWIPEANNGELLVFDADGAFVWAETQEYIGLPGAAFHYGQERGCYAVNGSVVTLTIDATCRPDGFAAYDLNNAPNGAGGMFRAGAATALTLPFTLEVDDTLSFFGRRFTRTSPN